MQKTEHSCHACEVNTEETRPLLEYMLNHNRRHADELYDIANSLDGEAKELVHAAVIDIERSNDKIAGALAAIPEK